MSKNQALFILLFILPFAWLNAQSGTNLLQEGIQLCEQGAYADAIPLLQSAYIEFEKKKDKSNQAKAQEYLAKSYLYTGQVEKAETTYRQAYQLSLKHGPEQSFLNSAEALGELYNLTGRHRESILIIKETVSVLKKQGDYSRMADRLNAIGINFLRLGVLDSAQFYLERGLSIKLEQQDSSVLEKHYNHLGLLFQETGDYGKAIDFQLKALKIMEAKNQRPQMAILYSNISVIFSAQNNFKRAEEYGLKAIAMARQENLATWLAASLTSLGGIRLKQNRLDEALKYYEESLEIYRETDSAPLKTDLLEKIGGIYMQKGMYEISETHFREGLDLAYIINKKQTIIDLNLSFVELNLKQNKLTEAKKFLEEVYPHLIAYNHAGKFHYYYKVEKQYYQKLGDHQKALASFRLSQKYKEEGYNLEQSEKVHELEERYERAKKDQKITQLNTENKIKDLRIQQSRRNNIIASLALALALGLMLLLYYLNRTRRLANERLGEKNITIANSLEEKEMLLKEIHHRVKNNLQVVSSLLRLQTKYIKDEKALDAIQEGRNRVKSMSLIHQKLYQVDNLTGVQASEYIEKLSKSLFQSYNIDPQRIHLQTDIDELNIDVDTIIPIGLILNELLTNALKHAFPDKTEGTVFIKLKKESDQLILEVSDNGVGMSSEKMDTSNEGGFGINLINSFLEKLKAQLDIQQENGTSIRLLIRKFKLV